MPEHLAVFHVLPSGSIANFNLWKNFREIKVKYMPQVAILVHFFQPSYMYFR